MKKYALLLVWIFAMQHARALNIRQLSLSPLSNNAMNVSLDTEAIELYYFQTWEYSLNGNVLLLKAFFVPGFGSTIEYLNNNFEIPIPTNEIASYSLTVAVYYSHALLEPELQDQMQAFFEMPLTGPVNLSDIVPKMRPAVILYPNPTDGWLNISGNIDRISVFDSQQRKVISANVFYQSVNLTQLSSGVYIVEVFKGNDKMGRKVILKQ